MCDRYFRFHYVWSLPPLNWTQRLHTVEKTLLQTLLWVQLEQTVASSGMLATLLSNIGKGPIVPNLTAGCVATQAPVVNEMLVMPEESNIASVTIEGESTLVSLTAIATGATIERAD